MLLKQNATEALTNLQSWLNNNQGVITLSIFLMTIALGWVSGIFSSLRRKPNLAVRVIDGPTFSCTYLTGNKHNEFDAHRTAIALYLQISNVGSSNTSIVNVALGYHWTLRPLSTLWWKNTVGWFWLRHQVVALEDFQVQIGSSTKVYPFLFQKNSLGSSTSETFLPVGRATTGVVYFEQDESWGGSFPLVRDGRTQLRVAITDSFGRVYRSTHFVPVVSLQEVRAYNPRFGDTPFALAERQKKLDESQPPASTPEPEGRL